MLHLASGAFKKLFQVPLSTMPLLRFTAGSAAFEREIPHIVPQAFTAFLESSGIALGGPGNEPFIR